MKRLLIAAALALSLAGCAGTPLGDSIRVLTSTIANPVSTTNVYQVENAYAAALEVVVQYRTYCWSKSYATILADPVMKPVCEKRRAVVRLAQSTKANARKALDIAEQFVANNPTLNASTVIQAAWDAVSAFQNSVPKQ